MYARALEATAAASTGSTTENSKPEEAAPALDNTKKKIISTLLDLTENEIHKQFGDNAGAVSAAAASTHEVISANNKRFKVDQSTVSGVSVIEPSTTAAPVPTTRASIVIRRTTQSDAAAAAAAAEAAAAAIANMHSMAFQNANHFNRNRNRPSPSSASSLAPSYSGSHGSAAAASSAHHHLNSIAALHHGQYDPDKINFDVNYRPTDSSLASHASTPGPPTNRKKDKQRDSLRTWMNSALGFVSSPAFSQARPVILNGLSTVAGQLLSGAGGSGGNLPSGSPSSSYSGSSSLASLASSSSLLGSLGPSLTSGLFGGSSPSNPLMRQLLANLRYAMLRRNEQAAKNSKKKGKLNSALGSSSSVGSSMSSSAHPPAATAGVQLLNLFTSIRDLLQLTSRPLPSRKSNAVRPSAAVVKRPQSSPSSSVSSFISDWSRVLGLRPGALKLKQEARRMRT